MFFLLNEEGNIFSGNMYKNMAAKKDIFLIFAAILSIVRWSGLEEN